MPTTPREIVYYQDARGREPFHTWLYQQDSRIRAAVLRRLDRLEDGLFGDAKPVGDGVRELRFALGAGYRVYFGLDGETLVVILCGGDKGLQRQDIDRAKRYWRDYLEQRP